MIIGKRLYWAGVAGVFALGLGYSYSILFLPHDIIKNKPVRTLEGVVVEERYMPSKFMDYEKYFVSLDTGAGELVSVKVMPGRISLGGLDVLVQRGTRLKVNAHESGPRNYIAYSEEVEIKR